MTRNTGIGSWEDPPYRLEYTCDGSGHLYATSSNLEFYERDSGGDYYVVVADNLTKEQVTKLGDLIYSKYHSSAPPTEAVEFLIQMHQITSENTTDNL